METKTLGRPAAVAAFTMLVLLLTLASATYAWFTSGNRVSTSRVTARSGSETVELQISSTGGADFRAVDGAAMAQVNGADPERLMPVSTADLRTFLTCVSQSEANAVYREVEGEKDFFHGRVYLRAVAPEGTRGRMDLYLDQTAQGPLAVALDGQLLNATRLGLAFPEGEGRIFSLSRESNAAADQIRNTWLNGELVPDGNVLTGGNGAIRAVPDPAVELSEYAITQSGGSFALPPRPLYSLELNEIYPVDIYFYLEGCDPDCSDAVSFHAADLTLAFFGVLS